MIKSPIDLLSDWDKSRRFFNLENLCNTRFFCCTCGDGHIIIDPMSKSEKSPEVQSQQCKYENNILSYINLFGVCSNPTCRAVSSISGYTELNYIQSFGCFCYPDIDCSCADNKREVDEAKYIIITNFYPSPQLSPIPTNIPSKLNLIIRQSFDFYWQNPATSTDILRGGVETLLDDQEIPRHTKTSSGRNKIIPLHDRIDKFEKKILEPQRRRGGVNRYLSSLSIDPDDGYSDYAKHLSQKLHNVRILGNQSVHESKKVYTDRPEDERYFLALRNFISAIFDAYF